ncbi:hypothetical protein DXG03_005335 [Asterophora parasitica]|uniref:Nuclear GTPase SLIP-GC n=1 Tax=Asterophora parasitica TaxID=117018 RepID=A0A9P7K9S4_9AGAR|nr:hypothetical protein DXG03_005335 [Asterophora parasitica]
MRKFIIASIQTAISALVHAENELNEALDQLQSTGVHHPKNRMDMEFLLNSPDENLNMDLATDQDIFDAVMEAREAEENIDINGGNDDQEPVSSRPSDVCKAVTTITDFLIESGDPDARRLEGLLHGLKRNLRLTETSHVLAIPKLDKANFISSYLREQKAHAKSYAHQGRAHLSSWKRETETLAERVSSEDEPEETRLLFNMLATDYGFGTPVLKPRVTSRLAEKASGKENKAEPRQQPKVMTVAIEDPNNKHEANVKRKRTTSALSAKPTKHKSQPDQPENRPKPTIESDAESEHAQRLKERRERKRAKRAIIKPTTTDSESEEGSERRKIKKGKVKKDTKARITPGLALMHGFSATNVGSGRLTGQGVCENQNENEETGRHVENLLGYLSTDQSKTGRANAGFTEKDFLNKTRKEPVSTKARTKRVSSATLSDTSSTSSEDILDKAQKGTKRSREPEDSNIKQKTMPDVAKKISKKSTKQTDSPPNSDDNIEANARESIVWAIENDDVSLLISEPEKRSVVLKTGNLMWSGPSDHPTGIEPVIARCPSSLREPSGVEPEDNTSRISSIGPSESASQHGRRPSVVLESSKYFAAPTTAPEPTVNPQDIPFLLKATSSNPVTLSIPEPTMTPSILRNEPTRSDDTPRRLNIQISPLPLFPSIASVYHVDESAIYNPHEYDANSLDYLPEVDPQDYEYSEQDFHMWPFDDNPGHAGRLCQFLTNEDGNPYDDDDELYYVADDNNSLSLSFHQWNEIHAPSNQDLHTPGEECEEEPQDLDYMVVGIWEGDEEEPAGDMSYDDGYDSPEYDNSCWDCYAVEHDTVTEGSGNTFEDYGSNGSDVDENRSVFVTGRLKDELREALPSLSSECDFSLSCDFDLSADDEEGGPGASRFTQGRALLLGYSDEADRLGVSPKPPRRPLVPSAEADVFLERGLPVPDYVKRDIKAAAAQKGASKDAKKEDVSMEDATKALTVDPKLSLFTVYGSADEIQYVPEESLKEGLRMVKSIKSSLKHLQLGSKLRQDVWMRELESLTSQGASTTLIAVCGATGAGKSSILNAILDDNIVPTSGMRACTAVVTELAYHKKSTIDADISFLSENEWKEELAVLLTDLFDEEGNLKRLSDLKSDAGVHAVYPSISPELIGTMSADQIIRCDPNIAKILGTTKKVVAKDSKIFAKEIGKYIDSKDQKRGDKKKDKTKQKTSQKTLMDKVREASGTSRPKDNGKAGADAPALWPLIRQVNVRCNAAALSTGAILVDLPGVADANAARNNIAKDYMKKCDCIWILAPITRAVDDKTARDLLGDAFKMQLMNGNYDDHAITFIASKCDDVSCSEVVRALNLADDPEYEEIQDKLDQYEIDMSQWKTTKKGADKLTKAIEKELKLFREYAREYKAHLEALQDGETFTPRLTAKKATTKKAPAAKSKKRKNSRGGKKGSSKRRRHSLGSDDDDDDYDESASESDASESEADSNNDSDFGSNKDSEDEKDSDDESKKSGSGSESGSKGDDSEAEEFDVTEESLKEKIKATKESIKEGRERLNEARKQKKDAADALVSLKKSIDKVQREKNAFCSLKRSDFSRDVLKEDFRVGLKDLDGVSQFLDNVVDTDVILGFPDAAAEERDPDNFNPNENLRDYDAIDLPVFTCSSRDYVRLKGQVKGDGGPTCFSNAKDTGIPHLQQWCHQLTVSSRERAARNFRAHLTTFATSVQSYVKGIGEVTVADREALRERWESSGNVDNDYDSDDDRSGSGGWASSDDGDVDPFAAILGGKLGAELYSMHKAKSTPKVDDYGNPVGISPRLALEFTKSVDKCVKDLQEGFRDGLEDKCKVGAANAAAAAVPTSDEFAASMHWGTYRATLRRHGSWRRDLNVELITPFTKNIAHTWSKVFESDLFGPFEAASLKAINELLKDFEDSAAAGLKDRTKLQGEQCLEEARVALKKTMDLVKVTMQEEQKEVSRCMAPHVQAQLIDGYDSAMEERGMGSVARQKAVFHRFIEECKDEIFDDGADVLMDRLTKAADAVGEVLDEALGQLAQKIEVNLSILWEGTRDDPAQVKARNDIMIIVEAVLTQAQLWTEAEQARDKRATINTDPDAMEL